MNRVSVHDVMPHPTRTHTPMVRVAVLVSLNFPDMTEEIAALVRRFTKVALQSLHDLAVDVELVDTSSPIDAPPRVMTCDGLLLLGGGDIDPRCYDAGGPTPDNCYGIDGHADRDAFDAIDTAERADIPILGICRGAQLINVHRGGTITPDLEDYLLHRGGPGQPMFIDEQVNLNPHSRLRAIFDSDALTVRSGHHQAVDELGDGLVVAARAKDGVVEALEDPGRWLVGVQWHPEDDEGSMSDRMRLLGAFVAACAHNTALNEGQKPPDTDRSATHARGEEVLT